MRWATGLGGCKLCKIIANTFALPLIEGSPCGHVFNRRAKYADFHSKRPRNSAFASCQSRISSVPLRRRSSVFFSSSKCHAGDVMGALSSDAKSSQSASTMRIFSVRGSWCNSVMLMGETIRKGLLMARCVFGVFLDVNLVAG